MRASRLLWIASVALAALLLPSLASADGITWTLNGVTFTDGATASGSFNYDASSNSYSSIDVTTGAGTVFPSTLYTTTSVEFFSNNFLLGLGPTSVPSDLTGVTLLGLYFTNALTNTGGTDPVYLVEFFCGNSNCSDLNTRYSLPGSVTGTPVSTPEPGSLLFLASGLLACFLFRPRA